MTSRRHSRRIGALVAGLALSALLVACTEPATPMQDEPSEAPTPETEEIVEESPRGLEETDFGNLTWSVRPGGNLPETVQVEFEDGYATDGIVEYEVGDIVHAELNDDALLDAAAQIVIIDGNAVEEQWYLWLATEGSPEQVTLPVARSAHCGTATHSVEALDGGGVEIHETRRHIGEVDLACSETGTDERVRTVIAVEARNEGEWWPVQVDPRGGFGGLCPIASDYESVTYSGPLHAVPDADAMEISGGETTWVFSVDPWPIYGEDFPGWVLVGVHDQDDEMWCAWAEAQ